MGGWRCGLVGAAILPVERGFAGRGEGAASGVVRRHGGGVPSRAGYWPAASRRAFCTGPRRVMPRTPS